MKTELKKYLFEHDLNIVDLANILGCNKSYMCRIVNGLKPGKRLARDIQSITNNSISFDDHIDYKEEKEKNKKGEMSSAIGDIGL
jgi:hypothetical protein